MTNASTWRALSEKCAAATGPDREIDLAFARLLDAVVMRQRDDDSGADEYTHWRMTASLDDIVALIERELPGWGFDLVRGACDRATYCRAGVFRGQHLWGGEGSTPALALCACFCLAKAALAEKAEQQEGAGNG